LRNGEAPPALVQEAMIMRGMDVPHRLDADLRYIFVA
jgi:hypothetical protein